MTEMVDRGKVEVPDGSDAAFRASVVGASEVSALLDCNPWLTRFELYHRKAGTIATPEFNALAPDGTPENERIYCGVRLEPVILEMACERWGYTRLPTPKRLSNSAGLGGHPDAIVHCPSRGRGVLEIKTADWLVAKKWGDEPPAHYLIQTQAYQGLAKAAWGDVIVLVGGNELRRYSLNFRPKLYAELERQVAEFWRDVRAGNAPRPDYTRDGATLIDVIGAPDESVADLRDDMGAEQDALDFLAGKALRDRGVAQMDAAKARLFERIGASGRALLPTHRIGCGQTKDSAGTFITADMVGTTVGGRKGYRRFDIREIA